MYNYGSVRSSSLKGRKRVRMVQSCCIRRGQLHIAGSTCKNYYGDPFLALLDYVSRAHEIKIRPSSVVRQSVRPSVCGIDYL